MTTSNADSSATETLATGGSVAPATIAETGTEGELVAALAHDVDAAFEGFVIAYRQEIVRFVARMLGDSSRAEDVAQDVFVRAYRALHAYSPERRAALRLRSWTYAIAHNLTRNAVRDAPPHTAALEFEDGNERGTATLDTAPGPEALAIRSETWHAIGDAIAALSPRLRPAYVMRYLDDLSYDEIAHALEQPVGTVKASAHRAAAAVRSHLEQQHV
jgi:RNA polymerase sigma-70 factor (ECF subfamily)